MLMSIARQEAGEGDSAEEADGQSHSGSRADWDTVWSVKTRA
jgi:hypothetical protein